MRRSLSLSLPSHGFRAIALNELAKVAHIGQDRNLTATANNGWGGNEGVLFNQIRIGDRNVGTSIKWYC